MSTTWDAKHWNPEKVFETLCIRLMKENASLQLRQFLFRADVSKQFIYILQSGAKQNSHHAGKKVVQRWLLRQQAFSKMNSSSEEIWQTLEAILDEVSSTPSFQEARHEFDHSLAQNEYSYADSGDNWNKEDFLSPPSSDDSFFKNKTPIPSKRFKKSSITQQVSRRIHEFEKETSHRKRNDFQKAHDIILGLLRSSPLTLWIDITIFQEYLDKQLPEYVKKGILDLQPIWDNLSSIPNIQESALEIFFDELSRQSFPWPVKLPPALRLPPSEMEIQLAIAKMVTMLASSPLKQWINPKKYEQYLQKKLMKSYNKGIIKLGPMYRVLCKNPQVDPQEVKKFILKLSENVFPWDFELPEEVKPSPPQSPSSPPERTLSKNDDGIRTETFKPIKPPSSPSSQKRQPTSQMRSLKQNSQRQPTSQMRSLKQSSQKIPNLQTNFSWQLDELQDVLDLSEQTVLPLPPTYEEKVEEGVEHIIETLKRTPLIMWLNPVTFREHLEKRLPQVIQEDDLPLEFLCDILSKIPTVEEDIIELFLEELLKQDFSWKLKLPKKYQSNKKLGKALRQANERFAQRIFITVQQKRQSPQTQRQTTSSSKTAPKTKPSSKSAPKTKPSSKSAPKETNKTPQENEASQASFLAKFHVKELLENISPLRAVLFILLILTLGGFFWSNFHSNAPTGKPIYFKGLAQSLPIKGAFAEGETVSIILKENWQNSLSKIELADKILRYNHLFNRRNFRYVRVYSGHHLVLKLDLKWSF